MEKDSEIIGYFGNKSTDSPIQIDDTIETICYESDSFQTFQYTVS